MSAAGRLTSERRASSAASTRTSWSSTDRRRCVPTPPSASCGAAARAAHRRAAIQREADAEDWRALLLLLARAPEDLIAEGGIGKAWAGTRTSHFEIREIDYAEVLRERAGGDKAEWDRIIALCLQGDVGALDERALGVAARRR